MKTIFLQFKSILLFLPFLFVGGNLWAACGTITFSNFEANAMDPTKCDVTYSFEAQGNGIYQIVGGNETLTFPAETVTNVTVTIDNGGLPCDQVGFILYTNGNINNGNVCGSGSVLDALPVELISFTAQSNKVNVALNWATSTELNNDYFDIERSLDGRSFQKIGRVKGAGTTNLAMNYSYNDIKPQKGQNYYRLKQVDFDGTFEYTNIVTAEYEGSNQMVKIIPTHSYGELNVVFFEVFEEDAPIEVFDLIGNRVLTGYLPEGGNEVNFDVTHLNSGQYYIRIRGESEFITKRFIKVE